MHSAIRPSGRPAVDQTIPQLSCAHCRDRKLKCDKLDPCSNCTSVRVTCTPIYRPRLPRGRHVRSVQPKNSSHPSTAPPNPRDRGNSNCIVVQPTLPNEVGARIDRLESLLQERQAGSKPGQEPNENGPREHSSHVTSNIQPTSNPNYYGSTGPDLSTRIERLESVMQKTGWGDTDNHDNLEHQASSETIGFYDGTGKDQPYNYIIEQMPHNLEMQKASVPNRQSPSLSDNLLDDLLNHEMYNESQNASSELPVVSTNENGNFIKNGVGGLRLLGGLDRNLYLSSSILLPRDKTTASKICRVYLRNVDPIIKILHRTSLANWMIDNSPCLAYSSEKNIPIKALEFAVCYVATNTMTEVQCQAEFQKSKSCVVAMYRKMCEDAIEMAELLTTRDIIVLQAFTLYLIGRRSEEKGTAVWALIALAIRLGSAMGLHKEPENILQEEESFFQQQMRLRLWLTICLMDLQASLAQNSEPLISYQDAASAINYVAHINDSEFDTGTTKAVSSHEDLTDTTFVLITYHFQIASRLLNFGSTESSALGASSTNSNDSLSSDSSFSLLDERQKLIRRFQQRALTLLHYCDPESSPYAWFTWHSTHLIISELRISELLPFRCGLICNQTTLLRRKSGDKILLQRALKSLAKAQLILSDPRGDNFRWYTTEPWLALSTAVVECNNCTDVGLLLQAWPVIEASYQHYESEIFFDCQPSQLSLTQLMSETRDKLAPIIEKTTSEKGQSLSRVDDSVRLLQAAAKSHIHKIGGSHIDPYLNTGSLYRVSLGQPFVQEGWDLTPMVTEDANASPRII